ncbi:MAG: Uma2 family endonuclease [Patulibacter sp.]|nr:Uma2 family endonuclease [Patulibacter sp.]
MHAMPSVAPQRMTAEEFLALPEREDNTRFELVDGEVVLSKPTPLHQHAVLEVASHLRLWSREQPGRGRVTLDIDTWVDHWTVLAPDVQWYAEGRELPGMTEPPWPLGDLVVEVRSPSTWHRDVGRKKVIYERDGVRELWLVDPPARTVLVFCRSAGSATFDVTAEVGEDETLMSSLLPGFATPVADLFG